MIDGTAADAAAIATGDTPAAGTPASTTTTTTQTPAAATTDTSKPAAGDPAGKPAETKPDDKKPGTQVQGDSPVPDKYDLKLPDNSPVDPTVVERTAAIARELGLSQDNAQKALGFVAQEVAAQTAAQVEALVKAHQPGGAEWTKTEAKWKEQSLADPFLGGGNPVLFSENQKLAERVAAKYGDEELVTLLKDDPMGSHPAVLRFLVRLGKASKESDLVKSTTPSAPGEQTRSEIVKKWFPNSPELHKEPLPAV